MARNQALGRVAKTKKLPSAADAASIEKMRELDAAFELKIAEASIFILFYIRIKIAQACAVFVCLYVCVCVHTYKQRSRDRQGAYISFLSIKIAEAGMCDSSL